MSTARPILILPSLLAADIGHLEAACRLAEAAGADGLHIDIMDGHFVPNLSMGPDVVRMARRCTRLPLSVHLMMTRPDWLLAAFLEAGANTILVHVEAQGHPDRLLPEIRKNGCRAGVTLNPETPAAAAIPFLDRVDEVLCMTVHPGFGGQPFIPEVLPKIAMLRERAPGLDLSVDGGLTEETAAQAAAAGANVFLVGTSLFPPELPDSAGQAGQDMRIRLCSLRSRIEAARAAP